MTVRAIILTASLSVCPSGTPAPCGNRTSGGKASEEPHGLRPRPRGARPLSSGRRAFFRKAFYGRFRGWTFTSRWAGYPGPARWNFIEGPATIGLVPARYRKRRVSALRRAAEFAARAGAPAIVTHCGFIPEDPGHRLYGPTLRAIGEVADRCRQLGIGFWFETGQETPVALLRVIEDLGLDNLGVNLDTANLILYGKAAPLDALDVIGRYVRCVHAKDGLYPTDGRHLGREVPIGQGKVNFPAVLGRLAELGFAGDLIIEREISGARQTADIRAAVTDLRGEVSRL